MHLFFTHLVPYQYFAPKTTVLATYIVLFKQVIALILYAQVVLTHFYSKLPYINWVNTSVTDSTIIQIPLIKHKCNCSVDC